MMKALKVAAGALPTASCAALFYGKDAGDFDLLFKSQTVRF